MWVPKRGTASDVFVIWLATKRENTVCDSKIVTSERFRHTMSLLKLMVINSLNNMPIFCSLGIKLRFCVLFCECVIYFFN